MQALKHFVDDLLIRSPELLDNDTTPGSAHLQVGLQLHHVLAIRAHAKLALLSFFSGNYQIHYIVRNQLIYIYHG